MSVIILCLLAIARWLHAVAFWIERRHAPVVQAERDAHLRELGKANESGAIELKPLDENWAEFIRRMEVLECVPVYVEWKP